MAQTKQQLAIARRNVRTLMEQVAGEVAALPADAIRELLPALQQAERETAAALQRWLATVPDGAERFTAHHYRKVLLQLRSSIEAGRRKIGARPQWLGGIGRSVVGTLTKGGRKAGQLATRHLIEQVAAMDQHFQSGLNPISIKQAAIVAKGDEMLVPRFRTSAARYTGMVWDDMRRQLAVGFARNETIDQMTNRLRRLGGPKGRVHMGGNRHEEISEGLFKRYRHWSERLVRTEVINAYNVTQQVAAKEAKKQEPGLKKRWDASLDMRVCVVCRDLHGSVAEVEGEFPGGYRHPPAHPNCRCASVVWHPAWSDDDKYVQEVLSKRKQELAEKQASWGRKDGAPMRSKADSLSSKREAQRAAMMAKIQAEEAAAAKKPTAAPRPAAAAPDQRRALAERLKQEALAEERKQVAKPAGPISKPAPTPARATTTPPAAAHGVSAEALAKIRAHEDKIWEFKQGVEVGMGFDKNGNLLHTIHGEYDALYSTKAQIKETKDGVFTHSHPPHHGAEFEGVKKGFRASSGTFSVEDLVSAGNRDVRMMRAVGQQFPDGGLGAQQRVEWAISPGPRGWPKEKELMEFFEANKSEVSSRQFAAQFAEFQRTGVRPSMNLAEMSDAANEANMRDVAQRFGLTYTKTVLKR